GRSPARSGTELGDIEGAIRECRRNDAADDVRNQIPSGGGCLLARERRKARADHERRGAAESVTKKFAARRKHRGVPISYNHKSCPYGGCSSTAEHRPVAPAVGGSIPLIHPNQQEQSVVRRPWSVVRGPRSGVRSVVPRH